MQIVIAFNINQLKSDINRFGNYGIMEFQLLWASPTQTTVVIHKYENQSNCSDRVRSSSRERDKRGRDGSHRRVDLDYMLLSAYVWPSGRYIPQKRILNDILLPAITYMVKPGCRSFR